MDVPSEDESIAVKNNFYNNLHDQTNSKYRRYQINNIDDLNARTGSEKQSIIIGPYGEQQVNDNGRRLIYLYENNNLKVMNGFYKHKNIHEDK